MTTMLPVLKKELDDSGFVPDIVLIDSHLEYADRIIWKKINQMSLEEWEEYLNIDKERPLPACRSLLMMLGKLLAGNTPILLFLSDLNAYVGESFNLWGADWVVQPGDSNLNHKRFLSFCALLAKHKKDIAENISTFTIDSSDESFPFDLTDSEEEEFIYHKRYS